MSWVARHWQCLSLFWGLMLCNCLTPAPPMCLCVVVFNELSEIAAVLFIQQWMKKKTSTEIPRRIKEGTGRGEFERVFA